MRQSSISHAALSHTVLRAAALLAMVALALIGLVGSTHAAQEEVRLENDYIAVIVNAVDDSAGRFALRTTGGDPAREGDEDQHLLFQQAGVAPRGSYTTFHIDGVDYVYGGPPGWRAGESGTYGSVVQYPVVREYEGRDEIFSIWQLGPIQVTQRLYFVRSSTTGLFDTLRIHYEVWNTGDEVSMVGARIMLDTELGQNDGAPFRVGDRAIERDTVYESAQLPDFWQAFDSLTTPRVIGQGTLRGDGLTVPDRVYFSNWGSLADGVWEFDFQPGREFRRAGAEFHVDSAIALMWDPAPLAPGERREYVTEYGLGGVSIVRGDLSLGVTSPARVESQRTEGFPVIVYVQNTGEGDALNVVLELCVPQGLRVQGGDECQTKELGHLPLGGMAQVSWNVLLDGAIGGQFLFHVEARAENLPDPVRATRSIEILGPPELVVTIDPVSPIDGVFHPFDPPRREIRATVTNIGGTTARDVAVMMNAPVGVALTAVDSPERSIGSLGPGESRTVTWVIAPLGTHSVGNVPVEVIAADHGSDIPNARAVEFVGIRFQSEGVIRLREAGSKAQPAAVGEHFAVDMLAINARNLGTVRVQVAYDPEYLRLIAGTPGLWAAFRGDLFVLSDAEREHYGAATADLIPWQLVHLPPGEDGLARVIIEADRRAVGVFNLASGQIGSLWFAPRKAGETTLLVEQFVTGRDPESASTPEKVTHSLEIHIAP